MKRLLSWLRDQLDAIVALCLGVAFAVLGLLDVVEGDALTEASLAVLAVLAFSVVRERSNRRELAATSVAMEGAVERIEETVDALRTGAPYRVLRYEASWDIESLDGSLANAVKTKRLRFLQDRVVSLYDYAQSDGTIEDSVYSPGVHVDTFQMGARRLALISLRRAYSAGEELEFRVERTLKDSFPSSREQVGVETMDPTDVLVLSVRWPADRPPTSVWLDRQHSGATTTREVEPAELALADGRVTFRHTVEHPPVGGSVTVNWDW